MATSSSPFFSRAGIQAVRAATALVRRFDGAGSLPERIAPAAAGPLRPAAIRVEQTRSADGGGATQRAVTVWFGDGPALPAPGSQPMARGALRLGAGVLGAAALAALTTVAAQREARLGEIRSNRVIDAPR